ncbi:UDP-N-acetylmuramate--L-alanine ligase [Endomicrobium proavitum]|uniref:UDP-N-acetylmuramate--L-alanine ligase n=1 Tax=Endomicrobium proavitum TaxID=1408281 RepID=A0A0G3WHZ3_9BACT|nr:UDP-N-acetylmuramate--L-alanine ligase [Endomicrobium proavitum]AKL98306.1 UDP-N-acetylmuramate:L-alanine ligase [Endomicrobium proavitum]
MFKKNNIHFVGIGGSGMSGIAEVLINLGHNVSGSDLKKTDVTEHLKNIGAKVFIGHNAKNIKNAQVVVTSTAVSKTNPEVVAALKNKIPVIPRVEMLAELARLKYAVTIAGTHGKTTTTSLTSLVLDEGGLDPTIVIGGKLKNLKTSARMGRGEYIVAEADESDGSFLKLSPVITVVTNIDNDHLDYYGNMENLKDAFVRHINSVPFYGAAIVCTDNALVREILPRINRKYITYGLTGNPDIKAADIKTLAECTSYNVIYKGKKLGKVCIKVPGLHNITNSLAAIGVGLCLNISFNHIAHAINKFDGVGRRMEIKGEKNGVTVIDDYGHHPTEVAATISAIKHFWPKRKLIVLFQPHRYTRTRNLYKEFGKSFGNADFVKVLDIYSAGEPPIKGVSSDLILKALKANKSEAEKFLSAQALSKTLKGGEIILTLGAGDVWKKGEELLTLI